MEEKCIRARFPMGYPGVIFKGKAIKHLESIFQLS